MDKISRKTVERLTLYLKHLEKMVENEYISSKKLGEKLKVTSSQIRKDLSIIFNTENEEIGKRGKGYGIKELKQKIEEILSINKKINILLITSKKIKLEIYKYINSKKNFNILGTLDISEPKKEIKEKNIDIAVIAVDETEIFKVEEILCKYQIKGVLNLTPLELNLPKDIFVETIDINRKLQEINFWKERIG